MNYFPSLAALVALIASPAAAEELKKLPEQLDPSKAYVLVELGALDGSKVPGELVLARYDTEGGDVLGHGRSAVELDKKALRAVHEAARKGMIKDNDRRTRLHLLELEPDLYVVEAANGTSFALGSRTFRADAGQVTDLGVFDVATDWDDGEGAAKIGAGDILKMALLGSFGMPKTEPRPTFITVRERAAGDISLPPMLAGKLEVVSWESDDATFGNHLGGLINRLGGRAARNEQPAVKADAPQIMAAPITPTE